jgi:hypothetical protein
LVRDGTESSVSKEQRLNPINLQREAALSPTESGHETR